LFLLICIFILFVLLLFFLYKIANKLSLNKKKSPCHTGKRHTFYRTTLEDKKQQQQQKLIGTFLGVLLALKNLNFN